MKMQAEGVDPKILDMDPHGPSPSAASDSTLAQVEKKKKARAAALQSTAALTQALAKVGLTGFGPKPSRPTKPLYIDKMPPAWVKESVFGGDFNLLLDSAKVRTLFFNNSPYFERN